VEKMILWFVLSCMLPCGAFGQMGVPSDLRIIKQVLERNVASAEKALVDVAEAMPEEKYSFAPTGGEFRRVRTFAQMAKHVAW
jgi:hypothetical protein